MFAANFEMKEFNNHVASFVNQHYQQQKQAGVNGDKTPLQWGESHDLNVKLHLKQEVYLICSAVKWVTHFREIFYPAAVKFLRNND